MMKKIFFIFIFLTVKIALALPDDPKSKSATDNYQTADANLTAFIFSEIKRLNEKAGSSDYLYEQFQIGARQLWKQSQTVPEFKLEFKKLYVDYLNEAYVLIQKAQTDHPHPDNIKNMDFTKKDLDAQISALKNDYKVDYVARPITDQFATIDVDQQTYIYKGVTYDIHDQPVTAPATPAAASPYACLWDTDNPRKLVSGPNCNADGSCICRGHVICERDGIKKRRLATCSERYCTEATAGECSAEKGYGSQISPN